MKKYSTFYKILNKKSNEILNSFFLSQVWQCRIMAACEENGISYSAFRDGLASSEIYLNTKVLADIACYEPKTFKSLATLAWSQAKNDGINVLDKFSDPPPGVFTRGMLK